MNRNSAARSQRVSALARRTMRQLGLVTESLNRRWYERNSGHRIRSVQMRRRHHGFSWITATLDGLIEEIDTVFEAKFMLPWSFSEEAAVAKHTAQLQHNMFVVGIGRRLSRSSPAAINGSKSRPPPAPLYQTY
jgi:predicted phage-related endonuclease